MMTRAVLACCVVGLLALPACAATPDDEAESSEGAISGSVRVGTIVETTTALRIRRTPSSASSSNILGILPTGTKVKIVTSEPTDGFYEVELLDESLIRAIKQSKGWCFGEHLLGGTPDEEAERAAEEPVEREDPAAEEPTGEVLKARFVSKNCYALKDDRGQFMKPTINDYVINAGGNVEYAALGINSDILPYGTTLKIAEIDAKPAVKNGGRDVIFKVVKTEPASSEPLEVTLCTMASGLLPERGSELTLTILQRGE